MTDFSRAERADDWLGKVRDWFYDKSATVGVDAWNFDPRLRQTRERSVRLLVRAVNKREREIGALAARGTPEVAARVRLNTVKGRDRDPRPAGPVTRAHDRARVRS